MPYRLEITLKPDLIDAEGNAIAHRANAYLGIDLEAIRTVHVITIDADLTPAQLETVRSDLFTNPVIQVSSFDPLPVPFDWVIWVGFRPGVRDNPGATAVEAIEDLLGLRLQEGEAVYTSKRYCLTGSGLTPEDVEVIARELLANDIIQQWRVISQQEWQAQEGVGLVIPKVMLAHTPNAQTIPMESVAVLKSVSDERNLALNPNDIPTIRDYFMQPEVMSERRAAGLSGPTDLELEYISQARSDHCNHNTFRGCFSYTDCTTGETRVVDNLFKTCIEAPTLALKEQKDWVISVLWDNAGAGRFDDDHYYVITGETHNSPSNMEAYGCAITGIVGVYRDPLGTGKGAKLVMGGYGFCVGPRDYQGELVPRLHPRRLLDGVIEGVKDGGNKSGIPTPFGQIVFDRGYLGKCLVFVTAVGIMPSVVDGKPAEKKTTSPGDLIIMCGGRVGKDGIHGVTASSESFSAHTPAGHVQIGDPYTQKKMHDFLLEARDDRLIQFITDNGGGGLSSSIGESARFSGGCKVALEKVPLKYEGLDQWEIWISESQERMTVAVAPGDLERFMALSRKHAVESTVIGEYTDSGWLHVTYDGETCAYVDMDLLESGFPQWKFEAEWRSPSDRGLTEPVFGEPSDYNGLLTDILSRPNICSKEWVARQYDHEVQGTSIVKPLVGEDQDVFSDAAVIRPVLTSDRGIAFAQALLPMYSAIDTYHMMACTMDEAFRRLVAVGADPEQIGGVDNFCWPDIQYHPVKNPDGKYKAAQLVRACEALRQICLDYEIPLLSGKDSMYVDGHLNGPYGETRKVSALPTMQFSATGLVNDIRGCVTMDAKVAGDLVYVLGLTKNELGASEYYEHFGAVGLNVPQVDTAAFLALYRAVARAIDQGLVASVHGIYRGGLGVHLAMVAMGGELGLTADLTAVPLEAVDRTDTILFSESSGRFIITVDPNLKGQFEAAMAGCPCGCIGKVTGERRLVINGKNGARCIDTDIQTLKSAWKKPFGELI